MKVIYTFFNTNNDIFFEYLILGYLSVIKSNRIYGNTVLYSNESNIEKIKKIGIPFTEYRVLKYDYEKYPLSTYSNILVYSLPDEPFIHIDFDVILNEPLPDLKNAPFKFSNIDINYNYDLNNVGLYETIFTKAYELTKTFGPELLNGLKLNQMPNMGIVQVRDIGTFKKGVNKLLNFYHENADKINHDWYMCGMIEQGLLHKMLLDESNEYKELTDKGDNFIFKNQIYFFFEDLIDELKFKTENWFYSEIKEFNSIKELIHHDLWAHLPAVHLIGNSKHTTSCMIYSLKQLEKEIGFNKTTSFLKTICFDYNREHIYDLYKKTNKII